MFNFPSAGTESGPADVVELLLDCHQRIRHFSELARRLGEADGLPGGEVRDAAARVRRYFGEALPLHVADEEESLVPRLRGREPEIDAALERMTSEHQAHQPGLAALLELCEALESTPARHTELRGALLETATALQAEFESHLAEEERVLIPALQRLFPAEERATMADEVRARRRNAWA